MARRVQEHEWHKTQKFFPRANHGVGMTLRVAITPDLVAWIAGLMQDCRIVAPLDLREDVARRQRRAAAGHGMGTEG